jgi:hypothetical protein
MTFDRPPDNILQALKEGLDSRRDLSDSLRKILTEDQPGDRVALKMYTVGLSHVATGVCEQLDFKGWRFLASDANKDGVVIDVAAPTLGHPPRVTGVQRGPNAAKVIEDLHGVFSMPEAGQTDVDLSFVNISGLMTEMILIKPSGGEALVVPYHTLIKVLNKQPYTLAHFASIAGPLAKRRYDQDDSFELSQDTDKREQFKNDPSLFVGNGGFTSEQKDAVLSRVPEIIRRAFGIKAANPLLEAIRPPAEKKKVPKKKVPKKKVSQKKVATKKIPKKK